MAKASEELKNKTYTTKTLPALAHIRASLDAKLAAAQAAEKRLAGELAQYKELPAEYGKVVQEYGELQAALEQQRSMLATFASLQQEAMEPAA